MVIMMIMMIRMIWKMLNANLLRAGTGLLTLKFPAAELSGETDEKRNNVSQT